MPEEQAEAGNPPQPGTAAPREKKALSTEALQYKPERKSYLLRVKKRFEYSKAFTIKKRVAEKEEGKLSKVLRPLLSRFMKKNE